MKTRTGKIARLPAAIREQINQQLFNGLLGKQIIAWLGAQPEVQNIVAEKFAGNPISENNISEWRRGGYQDWLREKQTETNAVQFVQKCVSLPPEERLKYIEGRIIAEFGTALRHLRDIPDPRLRMRVFQDLNRQFIRLKNLHTFGVQSEMRAIPPTIPTPANRLAPPSTY